MNAEEVFNIEKVPAFPSYRVASAFYYRADNSRFPFDTQRLGANLSIRKFVGNMQQVLNPIV
jgi:hypothetical protein